MTPIKEKRELSFLPIFLTFDKQVIMYISDLAFDIKLAFKLVEKALTVNLIAKHLPISLVS